MSKAVVCGRLLIEALNLKALQHLNIFGGRINNTNIF